MKWPSRLSGGYLTLMPEYLQMTTEAKRRKTPWFFIVIKMQGNKFDSTASTQVSGK
jgi:hypothetical protein